MSIDELLGIDPNDPLDMQADIIVNEHADLIQDLKRFRENSGLTVEQVAERMGWSIEGYLSDVEGYSGNEMRLGTLRRYCLALGVNIKFSIEPF